MALLLPRSWLTKAKHQVIISVIPLEGMGREKEEKKGRGEKCKLFTLRCCLQKQNMFPTQSSLYLIQLNYYGEFLLPPPHFFFSPFIFWMTNLKDRYNTPQEGTGGHSQDVNLWSAPVFEPVILQALWNMISYLVVIMLSITFHMVKLAMPHWITMNFNKASMLPVLLYGNPFSQHHPCLSEIW